jgi:hypothetical protein
MKLRILENLVGNGRMASVDFVTKTGRARTINGRTGVKKFTNGKGNKANPTKNGNLIVWETLRPQDKDRNGAKRYRTIKAENVKAIRADGVEIKVTK